MHSIGFIQDLAIIMLLAGLVTLVFHQLKQPVLLGYIVVGVMIGPHTPPITLISSEETIHTLAELGMVFLMFSLGLDFSIRKLWKIGGTALLAAFTEIVVMMWLGYEIGRFFDWRFMDALFLGSMLAMSSSTVIVKALDELGLKRERFAQIIFGILIVEDLFGIGMLALLSGIALTGEVNFTQVASTVGRLSIFIVLALVLGILIVPRLLSYVAKFENKEMLLVTVLGLCFGFCLLVVTFNYSIALGAFTIGAVMAESKHLKEIRRLIEPIRDMFSAIFFVTIGLMFNPHIIITYAVPIAVITLAVIVGKVITSGFSSFITGNDGKTSLRVGMGLAQIGEFAFIMAVLGLKLGVTSDFLYPIAVSVSVITTFLTPYFIRNADMCGSWLTKHVPARIVGPLNLYAEWMQNLQPVSERTVLAKMIRRILFQVFINFCFVVGIFLTSAFIGSEGQKWLPDDLEDLAIRNGIIWGGAFLLSLPFLIASYSKLKALSLLLTEMSVHPKFAGQHTNAVRRVLSEVIPAVSILMMMLLVVALSSSILPPTDLFILVLMITGLMGTLLWRRFVRLHTRLQIALLETLEANKKVPKKRIAK